MKNDLFNLDGKVAIVTGASRGLGKSMAIGLAKAGADVVVTDILDISEVVEEIEKIGRKSIGLLVDVCNKSSIETMVKETLKKFRRIDILVNNAGILRMGVAESMSKDDWNKVIDVNLSGQFLCSQEIGKQMIKQKSGKIINIDSIAGIGGYSQAVAYNASKAGIISLTKTLAVEWAKYNINVNAICPGVFATDMTEDFLVNEEFKKNIKNNVPLGRYATPDEIIGTAIYLASKASDYVTGHSLVIDGGWTVLL
ncbi:MAG: glucose 1-dehydrogenase [Thermoplasmatales archaeon]|nr:MAG: glucose 1-dehydrogenase [Thermoplasmatales archaeon]